MSKPLNYPESQGGGTLGLTNEQLWKHHDSVKRQSELKKAVTDYIEDDEPLGREPPVQFPCVRCGAEVGEPPKEYCQACLGPEDTWELESWS